MTAATRQEIGRGYGFAYAQFVRANATRLGGDPWLSDGPLRTFFSLFSLFQRVRQPR